MAVYLLRLMEVIKRIGNVLNSESSEAVPSRCKLKSVLRIMMILALYRVT